MCQAAWLSVMTASLLAAVGVAWVVNVHRRHATQAIRKDGSSHEHVPLRAQ